MALKDTVARPALVRPSLVNGSAGTTSSVPPFGGKDNKNMATATPPTRPSLKPNPPSAAEMAKSVAGNGAKPAAPPVKPPVVTGKATPIPITDKVTAPDVTNPPADGATLEPVYNASQTKRLEVLREQLGKLTAERDELAKTVKMAQVMVGRAKGAAAVKSAQAAHRREDANLDKFNVKVRDLEKKVADIEAAGMDKAKAAAAKNAGKVASKVADRQTKALAKIEDSYDIYEQRKLNKKEDERRNQLEKAAEEARDRANNDMAEFAKLLTTIKDEKLYQDYASFPEYCLARWNISKSVGERAILFGKVTNNLIKISALPAPPRDENGQPILLDKDILPTTESQTRELNRAGTLENQVKVWGKVVARCRRGDTLTAALIKEEVDKFILSGAEGVGEKAKRGAEKGSTRSEAAVTTPIGGAAIVQAQAALGPIPTSAFTMRLSAEWEGHVFAVEESADRKAYYVYVDDEVISTEADATTAMSALQEAAKEYAPAGESADPAPDDELVPESDDTEDDGAGSEQEDDGAASEDLFAEEDEAAAGEADGTEAEETDDLDALFDTSDADGV